MPYTPPPPPPPPTSGQSTRKPLGVPEGYTVPSRGVVRADVFGVGVPVPGTVEAPPRYYSGHEFAPATFGPERIVQLQRALASAGLIGPKTEFRLGVWDATSASAYRRLLEFANTYGYDQGQALEVYAQAPEVNAGGLAGDGSGMLPRARLSNPTDLAELVDVVAKAKIGRRVDDGFVQRFVAAYHRAEAEEAAGAASGGTYTAAPDPELLAGQMLEQEAPDAAFRQKAIGVFGELAGILTGGAPG